MGTFEELAPTLSQVVTVEDVIGEIYRVEPDVPSVPAQLTVVQGRALCEAFSVYGKPKAPETKEGWVNCSLERIALLVGVDPAVVYTTYAEWRALQEGCEAVQAAIAEAAEEPVGEVIP